MNALTRTLTGLTLALGTTAAMASDAPEDASAYFISPNEGETVTSPVTVRFGLNGMGVAPSGVDRENTGHHHLLVDVDSMPPMDEPIPSDDQHLHFGGGQTQTTLELEPGEHELTLLLGDETHTPHNPPVKSETITITVE
ncbi:DUF4399 domain-containing protein [Halomonadaceae bacterium KBTZ08]